MARQDFVDLPENIDYGIASLSFVEALRKVYPIETTYSLPDPQLVCLIYIIEEF